MISRRRFLTGVAIGLAPIGATAYAQEYKAQQRRRGTWQRPAVTLGLAEEVTEDLPTTAVREQ